MWAKYYVKRRPHEFLTVEATAPIRRPVAGIIADRCNW